MSTSKRKTLSLGTTAPAPTAQVLPDLTTTVGPAAPALTTPKADTIVHGVTVSAVPGGAWAGNTAAEIAEDENFEKDMEAACVADETARRKVYTVLHDLTRIFDADEMNDWPLLTPKFKDLKPSEHNLFIDEYQTTKRNKDNTGDVTTTGSRYSDMARALPWIKAWNEFRQYCVEAKNDPTKRKEEHVAWSAYRWDAEIKKYNQRVRNGVNMIKDSVRVFFQMREINKLPQIGCGLMTGADGGRLIEVGEPMAVWSKTEKDPLTGINLSSSCSSAAFLAMKVQAAIAAADNDPAKVTYTMLLASAGRAGKDTTPTSDHPVITFDKLEDALSEVAIALAKDEYQAQMRAKLAGKDKKGNPLMSDDYILTTYNAHLGLDTIVTQPEFQARLKIIQAAQAAAGMKAAQEKAVKAAAALAAGAAA